MADAGARRAVFVDANPALAAVADELLHISGMAFAINRQPDVRPDALPALLRDADVAIVDHTALPEAVARQCARLRHVVFLGTGARSYMSPEALADLGIAVHTIKGYGDTAVAEHAIALMWAAARGLARMDREMRAGTWLRTEGVQLTGKTLGLVGFGSIAAEVARIAQGSGLRVIAWNRTPRAFPGVTFVPLERLLADSDVVSLHLRLVDATRGLVTADDLARMKPTGLLVNTSRAGLIWRRRRRPARRPRRRRPATRPPRRRRSLRRH